MTYTKTDLYTVRTDAVDGPGSGNPPVVLNFDVVRKAQSGSSAQIAAPAGVTRRLLSFAASLGGDLQLPSEKFDCDDVILSFAPGGGSDQC